MLWWLTSYEFATLPQPAAAVATDWPGDSTLRRSIERPTLVFFMHPQCPCTRASLAELRKLLEASTLKGELLPEVIVAVGRPAVADPGWEDSDTVGSAALLPRTTVFQDLGGAEAERFGAVVSGTVMLFDRAGRKLFVGGLTTSRGHEGDSAGGAVLRELLAKQTATTAATFPTFGCRLVSPAEETPASCEQCQAPLRDTQDGN